MAEKMLTNIDTLSGILNNGNKGYNNMTTRFIFRY